MTLSYEAATAELARLGFRPVLVMDGEEEWANAAGDRAILKGGSGEWTYRVIPAEVVYAGPGKGPNTTEGGHGEVPI